MKKADRVIRSIAIGVGLVGCIILIKTIGWIPFIGFFLMLWANNITSYMADR